MYKNKINYILKKKNKYKHTLSKIVYLNSVLNTLLLNL